jgi:hypothetical protein
MKTITRIFLIAIFFITITEQIFSQSTTGATSPGTGSNVAGIGTIDWSNPTRITANDNSYATVVVNGSTSRYLRATNFGFAIPSTATIIGITAEIRRFQNNTGGGNDVRDVEVKLLKSTGLVGTNLAATGTEWPTNEQAATYGSNSNLWGTTWTPSEVNNAAFGVSLYVNSSNNRTASVDYISITLEYDLNNRRYSVVASGNWSSTSTWSYTSGGSAGAPVPTSTDDVFVENSGNNGTSATITVNDNAFANSITFPENVDNNTTLILSSNKILTVSGDVVFPRAGSTGNVDYLNLLNVASGTFNVSGDFNYTATGTTPRAKVIIGSGTMKVNGSFTTNDNTNSSPYIEIGSGLLRIGGAFLPLGDISLVAGSGTVEYFGSNQTIQNHSYANLSLSGSGTKTFPNLSATTSPTSTQNPIWTIQKLKIYNAVTLSLGYTATPTSSANRTYKVNMLYLWENGSLVGQNPGIYKGSGTRASDPFSSAIQKSALGSSNGVINAAAAALPVTLTSFTAKPTSTNTVALNWATSSEIVNKGFRIERQAGGVNGKFESLGFVGSKANGGNSQTALYYNFIDASPRSEATAYYRLAQEDLDGKTTFSEVRVVKFSGETVSMVYPNPSNGAVNISRTANGKKMNVQVIDMAGRMIQQFTNITDSNFKVNISKSGMYSIKITYPESGEQSVQRIVIER